MADAFTNDKIAALLQGTGDNNTTWGSRCNSETIQLLADAICGYRSISIAGNGTYTLNTGTEAQNLTLELTGTLTGNRDVVFPAKEGWWIVYNNTSGAFAVTLKCSGQTGITVTQAKRVICYCDGTDIRRVIGSDDLVAGNGATLGGNNTFTGSNTFNNASGGITIQFDDNGAAYGPYIQLLRNSASPAANDIIGTIGFDAKDSGGNTDIFAHIRAVILDPTNTSEDARLSFLTAIAGTLTQTLAVGPGVVVGGATGGDQGVGTLNATGLYVNGSAVTATSDLTRAGSIVQSKYAENATLVTINTVMPNDNTIPQVTEGDGVCSVSITPTSASNKLRIRARIMGSASGVSHWQMAVFYTPHHATNAVAATCVISESAGYMNHGTIEIEVLANSTSAQTINLRAGPSTGTTLYVNGTSASRFMGGASFATLVVEEVRV